MVKDQHPAAVQEATASIIPVWLEAFKVLLDLNISQGVNEQSWDGLAIYKELFKVSTPHAYIPSRLPILPTDPRRFEYVVSKVPEVIRAKLFVLRNLSPPIPRSPFLQILYLGGRAICPCFLRR